MAELVQVPLPGRTATLVFDEGPLKGAEIVVDVTLGPKTYFAVTQWFGQIADEGGSRDDKMAAARELAELFGPRLHSWNLADRDGNELPATLDSVRDLDIVLLAQIVSLWHRMLGSTPFPLPEASTPGPDQTAGRPRKRTRSTAGSRTGASSPRRSTRSLTSAASYASAP